MADNLTPAQRSLNMSRIRSRGNASTEERLILLLREEHLTGWRRGSKLPGRPDIVFPESRLAIFVDGCFWHGCPKCSMRAKSHVPYWSLKIAGNKQRDVFVNAELRRRSWCVLRIWEHSLRNQTLVLHRLQIALRK